MDLSWTSEFFSILIRCSVTGLFIGVVIASFMTLSEKGDKNGK